ncbi:MAG TPA: TetR/AcrR family transcriptional regulator [Pseudonocardia sp.]
MVDPARPPRRSRVERSADSRQLILDATLDCLLEKGYAHTTTLVIQARAGISRGRLLHHFPSREGLLVAACQHLANSHLADLKAWVSRSLPDIGPDSERMHRAIDLLWAAYAERYFWGSVELWTAARTDARLRETLLPEERRLGNAIRRVVDALFGPRLTRHPSYPRLRELLLTSMRGVALTYAFDQHRDRSRDAHLPIWRALAEQMLAEEPDDRYSDNHADYHPAGLRTD